MEIEEQKSLHRKFQRFTSVFIIAFVVLFILSFSFPHALFPDPGKYTSQFFGGLSKFFSEKIFGQHQPYNDLLISDSSGFYFNVISITVLALIIALAFIFVDKKSKNYKRFYYWFTVAVAFYLSMQLMAYGFSKVFKSQFYLAEPNTLYTRIGNTPRDLLYWTVMGSSRAYNIFMGSCELIAALLLLYRRTRLFAAILATGIFINVLAVNLAFDISVKVYSAFLLLLSILIIAPHLKRLAGFFFSDKILTHQIAVHHYYPRHKYFRWIKFMLIIWMLADAVYQYIDQSNYNDDKQARPVFHGAYEVQHFMLNGDTLPPLLTNKIRWKRIFVHRQGYLIAERMNDEMFDMKLEVDTIAHSFTVRNYDESKSILNYSVVNGELVSLFGMVNGNRLKVDLEKIDLNKLPLLQNEFHWMIDEIGK